MKNINDNKHILGSKFRVNTICLPFNETPNETYMSYGVTVVGWGHTEVQGDRSK